MCKGIPKCSPFIWGWSLLKTKWINWNLSLFFRQWGTFITIITRKWIAELWETPCGPIVWKVLFCIYFLILCLQYLHKCFCLLWPKRMWKGGADMFFYQKVKTAYKFILQEFLDILPKNSTLFLHRIKLQTMVARFFEILASTYGPGPAAPGPYASGPYGFDLGPLIIWKNMLQDHISNAHCSRSM